MADGEHGELDEEAVRQLILGGSDPPDAWKRENPDWRDKVRRIRGQRTFAEAGESMRNRKAIKALKDR